MINTFLETGNRESKNSQCKNPEDSERNGTYKNIHFETYKQLKEVAKEEEPEISKAEIYDKLLEPFKYEKNVEKDKETGKFKTLYI